MVHSAVNVATLPHHPPCPPFAPSHSSITTTWRSRAFSWQCCRSLLHNTVILGVNLKVLVLLQAVVERLEQEAADSRQAAKQEADERETALKGRYQAALQAAQDSELKHAER